MVERTDRSTVNGLVVERHGSGPPLVLVHGTNGSLRSFDPVLPHLAGFEVWTYARRDYEPSERSAAAKTFAAEADDLIAVIECAGGRAYVVGASYGGIVLLHAARRQPHRFIPPLILFEPPLFASGAAASEVLAPFRAHVEAGRLREAYRLFMADIAQLPAELLDASANTPSPEEMRACLSDLEALASDVRGAAQWADISLATVLLEGTETWDPMPLTMNELAAVLPAVTRRSLAGQSHFATHTAPDLFAEVIREELRRFGSVRIDDSLEDVDWLQAKADLAADEFDNGRTAGALRRSFEQSQHVVFARDGDRVVGMARLLSDGVCNAYLLDVWTVSAYRRRGIASAMIRHLLEQVPGQHVGLQTDHATDFYASLGFKPQPEFWSRVVGSWLDNAANRDA
jgi:pimeloyl-ACP methyl ester carboxylesterase